MSGETGDTDELIERATREFRRNIAGQATARDPNADMASWAYAWGEMLIASLTSLRAERDMWKEAWTTEAQCVRDIVKAAGLRASDHDIFDHIRKLVSAESSLAAEKLRVAEMEQTFNMRWNAQQRAIKRWQDAHPGNDLVWPDHADLIVWSLGELEAAHTLIDELKIARDREKEFYAKERDASSEARKRAEAAEQRIAALVGVLTEARPLIFNICQEYQDGWKVPFPAHEQLLAKVNAALATEARAMANLTKAQLKALQQIDQGWSLSNIPFGTGEALRRRWLAERDTLHIVRRIHAFQDGEVLQYECKADSPYIWHEWEITAAGRAALQYGQS